jgi:hypothetical protein
LRRRATPASEGSTLICASVTGRARARTACNSTATQPGSSAVRSGVAAWVTEATPMKHLVPGGHGLEVVSCLVVPDTFPAGSAVTGKRFPRVALRFLLHKPVADFHENGPFSSRGTRRRRPVSWTGTR